MIEIKKQKGSMYLFNLKTKNGHVLLKSMLFNSKTELKKTIKNLSPLIEKQSVFERRTNNEGKFLFNLKNKEGIIIGSSKLYSSEAGMENGIKNLKNNISTISNIE